MGDRLRSPPVAFGHEPLAARPGRDAQKKSLIAREQDAEARAAWRAEVAELDAADLVFRDETSTPTDLTPTHGRAPRGQRVVGRIPQRRWHAVTLLATLTPEGFGPSFQFPGVLDRTIFNAYVERILAPALRPGQTVILDNLSVHKSARARQAIEAAGCRVRFLPTYSPDFNPIEQAFHQLKAGLRRAQARSAATVLDATADADAMLTAAHARHYYRNAGYKL